MNAGFATRLALIAAIGGFLFGFDTSTMNAAIVGMVETLGLGPGSTGFLVAIALLGCAAGAWLAGPTAARHGRNRLMMLAGILIAASALTVALTSNLIVMGVGRFVGGTGIGAASAVVPGYIAEIAPVAIRGRLGSFWQFAIVLGQLLGLAVGFLIASAAGSEAAPSAMGAPAWRWMFVAVLVPALSYTLLVRMLPMSPHDLVRQDRLAQAAVLLRRLGVDAADAEVARIRHGLEGRRSVASLPDLRGPRLGLRPVVWVGLLLASFQQLVGISVVKTYSNTIWQAVGFSTGSAFTVSMITVLISIASTAVAIAIIDRVGRRTLLMWGAAAMAISLAVLALSFSAAAGGGDGVTLSRGAGIGALVATNVFAIAFGVSWGPVVWLMVNELFDTRLRTTAVAVCVTVNWLTNWLVVRTFPMLASLGLGLAYGLFAAFAGLAFLFALRVLPETRGKVLE